MLVQGCKCRNELANEAQRGVDVERDVMILGVSEEFGQPHAGGGVGNQRQGPRRIAQTLHRADVLEVGVAESGEPAHAFA